MPSHAITERERRPFFRLSIGPFFKALLLSILIELVVLVITGRAMFGSIMSHSAVVPRTGWENFLNLAGLLFHFIAFMIATPLGLFIFAPLIQIALMTCVLGFIFRARQQQRPNLPVSIKG